MRRLVPVLLALLAAPALGQPVKGPPVTTVAGLGTCTDTKPRQAFITNGASSTDCATGGGSTDVLCCCANGAWAACGSGGGSPSGAAGGDLGGTYPNPSVTDDSHAHGTSTISGLDAANDIASGTLASARLSGSYSINAATCTALAANPADCSAGQFANAAAASGDLTCAAVNFSNLAGAATDGQIPNLEDLSTGCASGELLKADAGGDIICGTAGSAAFTTLDGDYGAETVTSTWDLSGAKVELPNGTSLTSGDCDDASEAGRIFVDTDATSGQQIYVCEGAGGWKLQGDGGTGGSTSYSPDKAPAAGLFANGSDEFEDAISGSWRWQNQSGYTATAALDTMVVASDANAGASEMTAYWRDAVTGGTDFALTAKMTLDFVTPGWGIALLSGGSEATPTRVDVLYVRYPGIASLGVRLANFSFSSGYAWSAINNSTDGTELARTPASHAIYLHLRYTASTKALAGFYSFNGMDWVANGTMTLVNHPSAAGVMHAIGPSAVAASYGRYHWFRTCTSAGCLAGTVGE